MSTYDHSTDDSETSGDDTDQFHYLESRDDPDALYTVFRREWYVLEDHEGEHVLSCEYPMEVLR